MVANSPIDGDLQARLLAVLNRSGYPFQLRIAHEAQYGNESHSGWYVLAPEHAWRQAGNEGYSDMILANRVSPSLRVVVECKRQAAGAVWVFLAADSSRHPTRSLIVSRPASSNVNVLEWCDSPKGDTTPEAMFCAIDRGDGRRSAEKVEDFCRDLLMATEAIARAESLFEQRSTMDWVDRVHYFPVLVTTADLFLPVEIDATTISLSSGEILPTTKFQQHDVIRLTKNLWSSVESSAPPASFDALKYLNRDSNRSVFVVNAAGLGRFLSLLLRW